MSNMQETLRNFGTDAWVGSGPTVALPEQDKRLCEACRLGDLNGVKKALADNADPSVQFRLALGEVTPIFLCASKGYKEIAEVLIQYGADVHKKMDFDGTLCLHHASSNEKPEMCEFLIKQGCEVNAKDKLGRTALMDAAEIGSIETIDVLVKNGALVDEEDKEHHTALSYCIDFVNSKDPKFYKAAIRLVEHNANPNYAGKFAARTILHCAAAVGDLELVKKLVEQSMASVMVYDNEGKTPLKYAEDSKKQDVVDYLQAQMAAQNSGCHIL